MNNTKVMNALPPGWTAGEWAKPVRQQATGATPAWARTAGGIVEQWKNQSDDPQTLPPLRMSERLLGLFEVACCRSARIWDGLSCSDEVARALEAAVNCAETYSENSRPENYSYDAMEILAVLLTGRVGQTWRFAHDAALKLLLPDSLEAVERPPRTPVRATLLTGVTVSLTGTRVKKKRRAKSGAEHEHDKQVADTRAEERARQGQFLAGIVGPDWHLAPAWRTDTAVQIARGIYDRREFSAMPILADALEDNGCDDEEWLARMRDPEWPWCRGCHVLDSLLPELVLRIA